MRNIRHSDDIDTPSGWPDAPAQRQIGKGFVKDTHGLEAWDGGRVPDYRRGHARHFFAKRLDGLPLDPDKDMT